MKRTLEEAARERAELWSIVERSRREPRMPVQEPVSGKAEISCLRHIAVTRALAKCQAARG